MQDTRFGDFKFNALFGTNVQDNLGRLTLLGARIDPDPRRWSLTDLIRYRYYWNQAGRPLPQLGKIQLVDPVLSTTREITPAYTYDTSRPEVNANTKATYHYALGSVNGQFFKRRLIVLGAVRFDDYRNEVEYNSFIRDYPATWNGNDIIFKPRAPGDYLALSYMPEDAADGATGPATPALPVRALRRALTGKPSRIVTPMASSHDYAVDRTLRERCRNRPARKAPLRHCRSVWRQLLPQVPGIFPAGP